MIHSSWDIEHNILKLVILGHCLTFYPLKTPKTKILKNKKIYRRYHHFTRIKKITIIWCTVSEVWSETNFLCHFGPIFALLPPTPNDPENQNFEKKWKKCLEILSFYTCMCTINEHHMIYGSWSTRCDFCHFGSFFSLSAPWQPGKSKF